MKRSKHSLSHYQLTSLSQGYINPIGLTEVLPGDTFQHSTSAFIRLMPLATPVMHPVHAKIHHFFVPHRLVWDNWENFITGGPDGLDDSVFPTIDSGDTGFGVGSLADRFGIDPDAPNLDVSALPFRGLALIFNEYYRDQDLVPLLDISLDDGPDTTTNTAMVRAAWEKDYLTSARPWEQKGPSISVPLTGDADVVSDGTQIQFRSVDGSTYPSAPLRLESNSGLKVGSSAAYTSVQPAAFGDNTGLEADLSGVTAVDMNDLRIAMALQRYEEARARYGSRYTEYLRYLGVKSSDARLQRPEYLGGGRQTIQFSEVLQTAEGTDPVGQMRGHGLGVMKSNRYRRFFEEHGYVFSLMIVRPIGMYANAVPRTFNRRTKEDFWQKELQHVGQQAILNKEIFGSHSAPDGVFGYQDRYDEYRRSLNYVSAEMRTLLDSWNMARIFETPPALNADFVTCNPTDRNFAALTTDEMVVMAKHSIQARRLIAPIGSSYIF